MNTKRIYIIGGPGSGKSYAAKKLSKQTGIPSYDLDDIYWAKDDTSYELKTPEEQRNKKLRSILRKKQWIIEGSYTKWVAPIIHAADAIIILTTPAHLRTARLIKRTIRRSFKREKQQKENIKAFYKLMRFNHKFEKKHLKRVQDDIEKRKNSVHTFRKADDATAFILQKINI